MKMMIFHTLPLWSSTCLLMLETNLVTGTPDCLPLQYPIEDRCCPKCDPGTFVKRHCNGIRSTTCRQCIRGTFMDDYNGESECFPCGLCSPDLGLKTLTSCTVVKDTTCEPLDGFFCINGTENHCRAAKRHRSCQPGQYIRIYGTAATDTECSDCTSGTFSDGTFTVCQPHTQCEQRNLSTLTDGTTLTDAQCGKNYVPEVVSGVVGFVILLILGVIVLIRWIVKNRRKFSEKAIDIGHQFIVCSTEKNYGKRDEAEEQPLKDEEDQSQIVRANFEAYCRSTKFCRRLEFPDS